MIVKNLFNISDKVIVITGAVGLLGSQYVDGLSQMGANVVIADINYKKCKILSKKIKTKYKTNPLAIEIDITDQNSVKEMVNKTIIKLDL